MWNISYFFANVGLEGFLRFRMKKNELFSADTPQHPVERLVLGSGIQVVDKSRNNKGISKYKGHILAFQSY